MPGPGPASFPWPLWPHSFKSRLGHWQAASVRPARPIAFAGMNSPTLHCCPDARSRRPGTGSVTQWQGAVWIRGSSGVGVPAQAHPSLTTVTIAAQPSRHSKHAASRSAAAAAAWRAEAPLPAAERRGRHCRCTTSRSAAANTLQAEAPPTQRDKQKRRRSHASSQSAGACRHSAAS